MPTMRRAVLTTSSQTSRTRVITASVIAASRHRAGDADLDRRALRIGECLAALGHAIDHHRHDNRSEHPGKRRVHIVVENDPTHLLQGLGRGQHVPARGGSGKAQRVANEYHLNVWADSLIESSAHGGQYAP